jgi:hypothetical protein
MNQKWDKLYKELQADISRCLTLEHPEKENVENCFWIARNYWDQLQAIVWVSRFNGERDEIEFYREVKPAFASYIEYFSFVAEALQFEPSPVPIPDDFSGKVDETSWTKAWQRSVIDYWMQEEKRGERFYHKHQFFLDYCESDSHQNDREYFLPAKDQPGDLTPRCSHNRDTALFTIHEELLTTWQAFKMYREYLKKRIHEPRLVRPACDDISDPADVARRPYFQAADHDDTMNMHVRIARNRSFIAR